MKKTTKLFGLFAVAAMAVIGCAKEIDTPKEEVINEPEEKVVETHTVTISTGAPETKTVIEEGVSSASFKWSSDDASRFHIWENSEKGSDIALESIDEYATIKLTATFATVSSASYTYTAFLAKNVVNDADPQVPAAQTCTGTSYDPNADILVALPVTNEGSVLSKLDMRFGRPCVINKMTLKGLTEGETVSSVEIYADKPLTGYYDIAGKSWTGESQKITLTTSQVVPASGQVVVYFVTMPVEGATLTVTAITDAHVYNKTFGSTINFVMDQVTKFGVSSLGMFKYRDVITQSLTGLSTSESGYDNWSGKSYSGTRHSSAVYAGNTNKGVSYIQVRGKTNSGIISTTSGGAVKRVFVAYTPSQNPADGRITTVLGKNSAYSATSELYSDETKGEEVGTFTYHTGDKLGYINAAADYDYIALLPNGAIYFDEIDIFWDDAKPDPGIKWTADGNAGVTVAAASAALKTGTDDMPGAALYNPNSVSVSYSSTDEDVAEINSSTGFITLKAAGETTIKATFAGDESYKALTVSYTLTVINSRLTCATPTFSPGVGAVSADTEVTISSTTTGSTIYYTVDGSTPTTSSAHGTVGAASAPVTIDVAKTIKAIAVLDDWNNSSVASATYTISGVVTPLDDPSSVAITAISATGFTATWTNNSNATGYSWMLSTSSTAPANTSDASVKAYGSFTSASPAGSGASLSSGTWTLTKTSLSLSGKYYFYVKADGDGSTYSDSGYSSDSKILIILDLSQNIFSLTADTSFGTTNDASSEISKTVGDYTYKLKATNNCLYFNSKALAIGKSGSYITLPAIPDYKLNSVSASICSGAASPNVLICSTANTTAITNGSVKTISAGTSATWNNLGTSAETSYRVYISNAKVAQFTNLTLVYGL